MDQVIPAKNIRTFGMKVGTIGYGAYGRVHICFLDGEAKAVKLFELCGSTHNVKSIISSVNKEAGIIHEMEKSPHIINFVGVTKFDRWMGIVMDYMPRGDLSDFISPRKNSLEKEKISVPLNLRLRILYEIALGLSHLHNFTAFERIAHNDLKPSNVLLDDNLQVKICDFGGSDFATRTTARVSGIKHKVSHVMTVNYAAPECLALKVYDDDDLERTRPMDVFSYGMVIFFVITGQDPHCTCHSEDIRQLRFEGKRPKVPPLKKLSFIQLKEQDKDIFNVLVELMKKCYEQKPEDRPKIIEAVESLTEFNNTCKADVETTIRELKRDHPVDDRWGKQEKIGLEELCRELRLKLGTSESVIIRDSQKDIVSGTSQPMRIRVGELPSTLKEGDTVTIETKDAEFTCIVKKVEQNSKTFTA